MGVTLRYPYEVRDEKDYFDDIPDEKVPKDMLDLASHIVAQKKGHFEPEKFEDQYEDALKELLKKKQRGEKIEAPTAADALQRRQSDGCAAPERQGDKAGGGAAAEPRKPRAASQRRAKKGSRSSPRKKAS